MKDENNKAGEEPKNVKHLTPKELMKKHIANPDDVISDKEMKILDVDPEADKDLHKAEEEKLEELKNETRKHPPNPYDVLGG